MASPITRDVLKSRFKNWQNPYGGVLKNEENYGKITAFNSLHSLHSKIHHFIVYQ